MRDKSITDLVNELDKPVMQEDSTTYPVGTSANPVDTVSRATELAKSFVKVVFDKLNDDQQAWEDSGTRFKRKPTPLTPEELTIAKTLSIDITSLLPKKPDVEIIKNILAAEIAGEEYTGVHPSTWNIPSELLYPYWQMEEEGEAVIRLLPDTNPNNQMGFVAERRFHALRPGGGTRFTFPCMVMFGEACPVCKKAQECYRNYESNDGHKYYVKRQYLVHALIKQDPIVRQYAINSVVGHPRLLSLGRPIFDVIKGSLGDGTLTDDPTDFEHGTDLIIKKTMRGNYPWFGAVVPEDEDEEYDED